MACLPLYTVLYDDWLTTRLPSVRSHGIWPGRAQITWQMNTADSREINGGRLPYTLSLFGFRCIEVKFWNGRTHAITPIYIYIDILSGASDTSTTPTGGKVGRGGAT